MAEEPTNPPADPAEGPGQEPQQTDDSSQQQSSGEADASEQQQQNKDMIPRSELQSVVRQRQSLKGQLGEVQGKLDEALALTAKIPSDEDLQLLADVKAQRAEQERSKALKDGDADKIATAARKPLEEEIKAKEQENQAICTQLSTLLRDNALNEAIDASEHKPPDRRAVRDALYPRIKMALKDSKYIAQFVDANGQEMYDANGKVTDMQVFVDAYLAEHPTLCGATANPGSGAQAQGGPAPQPTDKPKTLEEFNALSPEKRQEVARQMTKEERDALRGGSATAPGQFL